jgi:hypothetical protein
VSLDMPIVINVTGAFRRITSVYAGLKEVKSTISSSKSSRKLAQSCVLCCRSNRVGTSAERTAPPNARNGCRPGAQQRKVVNGERPLAIMAAYLRPAVPGSRACHVRFI